MNILKLKNRYLASTVLQYSLFTTLVMIAFWLVLRLLGGGDQPWFYIVNFFILILGIFQVDKTLIQRGNPNHITLVISGILYGNITALLFAFYTILYLGLIDTTLLHQLQNNTY